MNKTGSDRIKEAFAKGKAWIPFFTCGDPDLDTTGRQIREAVKKGAAMVELGIPFSDPTAEGPLIQAANLRALEGGVTTDSIFAFVQELRKEVTVPFLFMTYANVIFSYGAESFLRTCAEIGIAGILVPDLPFEEKEEFAPLCRKYQIALLSMVAPSSGQRIAMIAKEAEGFLYILSGAEAAGEEQERAEDFRKIVKNIRENTDIPCAIGFEAFLPEQAKEIGQIADGMIVGQNHVTMDSVSRGEKAV